MKTDLTYEEYLHILKEDFSISPDNTGQCAVTDVLGVMQGKWKNHILFTMCRYGTLRFGEIKKFLPQITNTALTNTLRELEESGLVTRIQFNEIPPHVEYTLTAKGEDLMPIFYEIYQMGSEASLLVYFVIEP